MPWENFTPEPTSEVFPNNPNLNTEASANEKLNSENPNLNNENNTFDLWDNENCPSPLRNELQECKDSTNKGLTELKEEANLSIEEKFALEFEKNIDKSLGISLKEAFDKFTIFDFIIWDNFDNFPSTFVEFLNYFWEDYMRVLANIMLSFKINWMNSTDVYIFSFKNFKKISSIDEIQSSRTERFITWTHLISIISHSDKIHKNMYTDKIAKYFPEIVKGKPYKK